MTKNTALKGCLGGCAGLGMLGILCLVVMHFVVKNLTPEQQAALKAHSEAEYDARRAQENVPVDAFLNKFRELRARLPQPAEMKEQLCPTFTGGSVEYPVVDFPFLEQFTDAGFVPAPGPNPWYRGKLTQDLQGALAPNPYHSARDNGAALIISKEVAHAETLAVIVPVEQRWPVLDADGKTFQSGWFRGWLVLVDGKDWKPLGQTEFTSQNSEKVTSLRVGLGGKLVGPELKEAMESDFTDRFWKAADHAVAHLCGHDGSLSFASHEESFPTGD